MLNSQIIKTLALSLALSSSAVMAGEASERWNMSEVKQQRIYAKAAELGLDLSLEADRQTLHETMKEERIARAAEMGFDITTEDGKAAFREERHENREAIRGQIAELSEEDRAAFREELKDLSREERRELIKERFES